MKILIQKMTKRMSGKMNKAIFLDRDNTLNVQMPRITYKVEDLKLLPGVIEGLKLLESAGYKLYIVTNQSGIARGEFSQEQADKFMWALFNLLMDNGIFIHDHRMCPHDRDSKCSCRKPSPEMILELAKTYDIDLNRSWMIGDQSTDIAAGRAAGCKTILLDWLTPTLKEAAQHILLLDKVCE